jgi:hypothetical protein
VRLCLENQVSISHFTCEITFEKKKKKKKKK